MGEIVRATNLPPGEIRIASGSPRGAGLGASSALTVALLALSELVAESRLSRSVAERSAMARDLEARLMGLPTGLQDHYPGQLGGLLEIAHEPGGERVNRLDVDLESLGESLLVASLRTEPFLGRSQLADLPQEARSRSPAGGEPGSDSRPGGGTAGGAPGLGLARSGAADRRRVAGAAGAFERSLDTGDRVAARGRSGAGRLGWQGRRRGRRRLCFSSCASRTTRLHCGGVGCRRRAPPRDAPDATRARVLFLARRSCQ